MPRALLLCLTIVAAFPLPLGAAPPISDDVPVPVSIAAVARSLGLDPARQRARFMAEFVRLLYTPPDGKSSAASAVRAIAGSPAASGLGELRVPVPLSAAVWSAAVFRRAVPPEQLVAAIAADRRAALLLFSLAALDDSTLDYLAREPSVLTRLHQEAAPAFGAFGSSLRIVDDRVVASGGSAAGPLWEAVLGEPLGRPDRFIRALFGQAGGRIAHLYDTIAQLDEARARFAVGEWIADAGVRQARFTMLANVSIRAYGEWRLDMLPFSRPLHDLSMLLMRMRVAPSGAPAGPASQAFWTAALATDDVQAAGGAPARGSDTALADAAWLAETTLLNDLFVRASRLEQIAFGQRVFAGADAATWPDAITAIRGFRRYRMMMLTLERMGIRAPATYATAARCASQFTVRDPNRMFWTLAQFQGAFALVGRMRSTGSLSVASAERLVGSLCAFAPNGEGRYLGGVARWFDAELEPVLPAGELVEDRLLAALAGPPPAGGRQVVQWEGEDYELDLAQAERRRLHAVRQKQGGPSVDSALGVHRVARMLAAEPFAAVDVRGAAAALARVAAEFGEGLQQTTRDLLAPGVQAPRAADVQIASAIADLEEIARSRDARRAGRVSSALLQLVDTLLGEALLSLTYAVHLGDPGGAALLARNVALRHDFGLTRMDSEMRVRTAWGLPRQDFLPGVPWHVTGSVLGLGFALAPLSLRRISPDRLSDAPRLPSNEREAFALGVALMDPVRLTDTDRDAIAAGVAHGRRRVEALASRDEPLDRVTAALGLDGWRRRALEWMVTHDPSAIPAMFSLSELLILGGGAPGADLDAWGTAALNASGCPCTQLIPTAQWRMLGGRPQLGLMGSAVADLNLHVAVTLAELGVPARLARSVLAAAVQEYIEEVAPADANDWWTLVRGARNVRRERIEDYVAAAAAVDGPLVPVGGDAEVRP
jgi:hypothetical protein